MNYKQAVVLLAIASAHFAAPSWAQPCVFARADARMGDQLLPPRVDRVRVRATQLAWGMAASEVERIMGLPERTEAADGGHIRVLTYPAEPIATTVTITDDRLSGVALDIARDDRALPAFSKPAWVGLARVAVLWTLGMPAGDCVLSGYGMSVEQMIFKRSGSADVSIFLINGRVAARKVGTSFPADIFSFALPLAPDPAEDIDGAVDGGREQQVHIGMHTSELDALFGPPTLPVDYTFKGRPAVSALYEMRPGKSFGRFTLVDGVLTQFESEVGSLDQFLNAQ